MNLPTLISPEPSETVGAVLRLAERWYLPEAGQRDASGYLSASLGWPSSLPTKLQPEASNSIQLSATTWTGTATATSLKLVSWTEIRQKPMVKPADDVGDVPHWLSGLLNELPARLITSTPKCPEGGYKPLVVQLQGRASTRQDFSERDRILLNTCLLQWADNLQQRHLAPFDPFRAVGTQYSPMSHHWPSFPDFHTRIFNDWAKEIPDQLEVRLLVHGLRLFLDNDVEKARLIARRAVSKFPWSTELEKIWRLLTPSKVVTHPGSGVSRKRDFEWIRANQNRYRGQWIAIYDGQCLASGKDLRTVRESARKQTNLEHVLITYLPTERGS
jgi:hypothetical protein